MFQKLRLWYRTLARERRDQYERQFDERQRMEHGRAYRNGFLTFIITEWLIRPFIPRLEQLVESWNVYGFLSALRFLPPLTVFFLTLILRDALSGVDPKAERSSLIALHGFAAVPIGITLLVLLTGGEPVVRNGLLTSAANWVLLSADLFLILAVYWGARLWKRRRHAGADGV